MTEVTSIVLLCLKMFMNWNVECRYNLYTDVYMCVCVCALVRATMHAITENSENVFFQVAVRV